MDFPPFFARCTGEVPFPYQKRLATGSEFPDLLEAPTGAGKTAACVLAWLWRRRFAAPAIRAATPRRLVYCLPMRTLVDQTLVAIRGWLQHLELTGDVGLHGLLGGAVDESWEMHPDRDAILVGTQDHLLSRALNRGYAMSRFRWPVHFGLLNNDTLWVLDETQLMGVGLSTSTQLHAFRQQFGAFGPARSLWMSATLEAGRLATIDFRDIQLARLALGPEDRADARLAQRLSAIKRLERSGTEFNRNSSRYTKDLATEVLQTHRSGTLTLVVMNRVVRARELYAALRKQESSVSLALVHSRFRPADRQRIQEEVLTGGWEGILVATQAIEAGVDISAATLFTELAPWSSLVQRFGRCNRRGEHPVGRVYWIDLPEEERDTLPYEPESLARARSLLIGCESVGPDRLASHPAEEAVPEGPVLRRRDLFDLFDTEPDLTGCDLDVSRYIRGSQDSDIQLFWRTWEGAVPSEELQQPHRDELCSAPISEAREFLKRMRTIAFRWDGLRRRWERADRVIPGMMLLLPSSAGGYDEELGWTADPKHLVKPIARSLPALDADESDELTVRSGRFLTLAEHTRDVLTTTQEILAALADGLPSDALKTAARWHDIGKAHSCFQEMLLHDIPEDDPLRVSGPWAKSAHSRGKNPRRHFRHELASALALLQSGGGDLEAYLIAAHHGKVRLTIRSRPTEPVPEGDRRFALGVWEGDVIGPLEVEDLAVPALELDLSVIELGEREGHRSWLSRSLALLEEWGPFRLAYLESLLRVADWRASAAEAESKAKVVHHD
ncbi:MAG TPA: CRISPR-associated helicase Cas3' [Longimicrobiaceae bacterium]|nr:CRISPR-associated helicase Cas3' [Longimicrobiaceae bacterium]